MKRLQWTMLVCIALFSLLLAACGETTTTSGTPGAGAPTTAPGAPTTAAGEPTAAAGEPTAGTTGESTPAATTGGTLVLWTKEGGADLEFVKKLATEFGEANGVTIEVINKDVETLRTDFLTAAVAGSAPDLLWTVNDHAGPFVLADLIQSVDEVGIDTSTLVPAAIESATVDGKVWGVPITAGNQLLLLYNKKIIDTPPATSEEMIMMAKEHTDAANGTYGLVYNQTEPFWLVPWLGGFGGSVFGEDGKTPTLNTPEMASTLQFLKDLKDKHQVVPTESDYNTADSLFQEGKAAMIINGDWSLSTYAGTTATTTSTQNLELGVAPLPDVSATAMPAAPYTAGTYFMFPKSLTGDKLELAKEFVAFVTTPEVQERFTKELKRLPALQASLESDMITSDPILAGAAEALTRGAGFPAVAEMRCNWDAMKPNMQAVLAGQMTPEEAASEMQIAAETCVQDIQ